MISGETPPHPPRLTATVLIEGAEVGRDFARKQHDGNKPWRCASVAVLGCAMAICTLLAIAVALGHSALEGAVATAAGEKDSIQLTVSFYGRTSTCVPAHNCESRPTKEVLGGRQAATLHGAVGMIFISLAFAVVVGGSALVEITRPHITYHVTPVFLGLLCAALLCATGLFASFDERQVVCNNGFAARFSIGFAVLAVYAAFAVAVTALLVYVLRRYTRRCGCGCPYARTQSGATPERSGAASPVFSCVPSSGKHQRSPSSCGGSSRVPPSTGSSADLTVAP